MRQGGAVASVLPLVLLAAGLAACAPGPPRGGTARTDTAHAAESTGGRGPDRPPPTGQGQSQLHLGPYRAPAKAAVDAAAFAGRRLQVVAARGRRGGPTPDPTASPSPAPTAGSGGEKKRQVIHVGGVIGAVAGSLLGIAALLLIIRKVSDMPCRTARMVVVSALHYSHLVALHLSSVTSSCEF